jgi:excisionase family DNA binding protein
VVAAGAGKTRTGKWREEKWTMAKMYYTEDEAASRLGVSREGLGKLISQGKVRVYADGARKMLKVSEVDAIAAAGAPTGDQIQIDTEKPAASPGGKEDTVITAEGISIFDDEDLDIESADPMAKTTIAPSVEDQISLEGVGSGSGLLDLTRESDDTSLGAEVLEHIDVEAGSGQAGIIEPATSMGSEGEAVMEMPAVVETMDATAGIFSGMVGGCCVMLLVTALVAVAALMNSTPSFVVGLQKNLGIFLGASVVVVAGLAVVGYVMGKAATERAAALQRSR